MFVACLVQIVCTAEYIMSLPNWCLYGHLIDMCCAFLIGFHIFLYVPWSFSTLSKLFDEIYSKGKTLGWYVENLSILFILGHIYRAFGLIFLFYISLLFPLFSISQSHKHNKFPSLNMWVNLTKHVPFCVFITDPYSICS